MNNYKWRAVEAPDSSPVVVEYQTVYHAGLPDEHILCTSGSVETAHAIAKAMEIMNSCSCLMNLKEDEPFFVLRGQDITAVKTLFHWIGLNINAPVAKLEDATSIMRDFVMYPQSLKKQPD